MRAAKADARPLSAHRAHAALTLVEVLVALALAAILVTALLLTVRSSARLGATVGARAEAGGAAPLARSLLRFELERAGRAAGEGGLRVVLDPAGTGGDAFHVRYLAEAHRVEPVEVDATFFAAPDSQGRPNLYRRPHDGVRQPWLLGVTGLHLIAGIRPDGERVARDALPPAVRLSGLEVEIRFARGDPTRLTADTSRAGEVRIEEAP